MRNRSKQLLVSLCAIALLGIGAGTASATHFQLLEFERGFRIVYPTMEFSTGGFSGTVRCRVTVEGTFHRSTYAKVSGTLVGYITRARVQHPCTNGEAWTLTAAEGRPETLPWHVQYVSFTGTLPTIATISQQTVGSSFLVEQFNFFCLARSTQARPIIGSNALAAGSEANLRVVTTQTVSGSIPLTSGGGFGCPSASGTLAGTSSSVTQLGNTNALGVRLI